MQTHAETISTVVSTTARPLPGPPICPHSSDWLYMLAHRATARLAATVTRLQALVRGTQQRRTYLLARQHIVHLQAAFRAYPVRMHFLQAKGAAIWIQSCWRRHQAQRTLTQIKVPPLVTTAGSTYFVSKLWHSWWCNVEQYSSNSCIDGVQVNRQPVIARTNTRQHQESDTIVLNCIGLMLQGAGMSSAVSWTCCIGAFQQKELNTFLLQSLHKRHVAISSHSSCSRFCSTPVSHFACTWGFTSIAKLCVCVSVKAWYLQAAMVIQRVWRGSLVRHGISQANSAATVIQRFWRGHVQQSSFSRLQGATVSIQARVRQWQATRIFAATRAAVITIQVSSLGCMVQAWQVHAYHQQNKGLLLLICPISDWCQHHVYLC